MAANSTCSWIINPASTVKELKLTLVRKHMVGSDLVSIRLTNQQDLVAHSGPDSSNWKLYIKVTGVFSNRRSRGTRFHLARAFERA